MLFPAWLAAQATPTVPSTHPVYAFIDRLVGARLVDTAIMGQRAMSRREIGRIIAEARARADTSGTLGEHLQTYAAAFPVNTVTNTTLLEADFIAMDSPARGIGSDGNGEIQVALNPLASNQLGRAIANGTSFSYRMMFGLSPLSWLSIGADQRLTRLRERSGHEETSVRFDALYARALWRNVAVLVGRDPLFLGQGNTAGLALSMNARAVDQIRVSSDAPFLLPSILRYAGPMHVTAALGDLGEDQRFPHTRLFTYKVSSRPHPRFEIGTGLVEQVGGEGSVGGTFLQKAGDAFPLLDALFLHRNTLFSNKFVFVDLRYTIPFVSGAQFYAEGSFDDFDLRRVRSVFTEDAGYVWGLSASCFRECGRMRVSTEYHVTGLRYYTHLGYSNGFTLDDAFLGDPLGPRGRGVYGSLDVTARKYGGTFDVAYEDRSGNLYGSATTTPDDSDFRFIVIGRRPAERRWRTTATATLGAPTSVVMYSISAGAERVENFGHIDGAWRTNWLTRIGVQVRPRAPLF